MSQNVDTSSPVTFEEPKIQPKAFEQNLFWIAVGVYSLLLLVGSVEPITGIIGLFLLGLIALFKVVIRNFQVIAILFLLGIAALAIPFLLIIYIPVLLYFFVMRLGYLFQHFMLVLSGLFVYFFPIGIMANSISLPSSAILLIIPAVCFPLILKFFVDNHGYTVQKALEIMSEAPILIISIILPFLKLNIGGDFSEGVGSGETATGEAAAARAVPSDVALMKDNPIYKGAFASDVSVTDPYATTAMMTANSSITVNGFFQQMQDSQQIQHADGTTSTINSNLNQIRIGDHGSDSVYIEKHLGSLRLVDSQGEIIGSIKQNGASLNITDEHNFKIGSIVSEHDGFNIKDSFGKTVSSISQNLTGLDTFTADSIADIDLQTEGMTDADTTPLELNSPDLIDGVETEPTENKIDTEVDKEIIDRHELLSVALLSLLGEKRHTIDTSSTKIDLSKTTMKSQADSEDAVAYRDDCFYAYIQMHASEIFKNNARILTHEKIRDSSIISLESMISVEEKFGIPKQKMLLMLNDAFIFTGTNGMILTEDHIYLRAMLKDTQIFSIKEITSLGKQSFFYNEARFKNGRLTYNFQDTLLLEGYNELIRLFEEYRNKK